MLWKSSSAGGPRRLFRCGFAYTTKSRMLAALCLKGNKLCDQLRDITEKKYWVYGITEPDFDHAVDLVRELIDAPSGRIVVTT